MVTFDGNHRACIIYKVKKLFATQVEKYVGDVKDFGKEMNKMYSGNNFFDDEGVFIFDKDETLLMWKLPSNVIDVVDRNQVLMCMQAINDITRKAVSDTQLNPSVRILNFLIAYRRRLRDNPGMEVSNDVCVFVCIFFS